MKKLFFLSILTLTSLVSLAQGGADRYAYIERFKDIAISEMERAGVPASIKLAQGILESNAGDSYLARQGNNHFGIKCGKEWKGKTIYRKDDDYENGKLIESCFRKYERAEESYIDHTEFLRDPKKFQRYGHLFDLEITDYKRWARGLKQSGYATAPTYDATLIRIIETYNLDKYDRMTSVPSGAVSTGIERGVTIYNDVKMTVANQGESLAQIAIRTGVPVKEILRYNENFVAPNIALNQGERIFLQPKRSGYRGSEKYHYVKEGETMFSIAQRYGVKTSRLYNRNRIPFKNQPNVGQRLKLRGWKIFKKDTPTYKRGSNVKYKPGSPAATEVPTPSSVPSTGTSSTPSYDTSQPLPGELPRYKDGGAPTPPPGPRTNPTTTGNTGNVDEDEFIMEDEFGQGDDEDKDVFPGTPVTTGSQNNGTRTPSTPPSTPPPSTGTTTTTSPSTSTTTGSTSTTTTTPPAPTPSGGTVSHKVVQGNTLYSLSRMYGVTVDQIKARNNLVDNVISIGQVLIIK